MDIQVEICCGSYYDALQAQAGGAKRIELNSALHMGGLTPSVATLRLVKQHTDLSVITMIRPRGAGFHYIKEDFEVMVEECKDMLEHGADGIVFGCLDAQGNIDVEQSKCLIDLAKAKGKEVVYHRAFDCVSDPYKAMQTLIDLGVDRVLTSGTYPNVSEGKDVLKELQARFKGQIEILAGCGVNASNAKELIAYTGVEQIHSSCKDWVKDETTCGERVNYCYGPAGHESDYEVVSKQSVENLLKSIQ
ncbi:MAG: copper homeostasis protein CutC [Longicatena sp.]